MNIKYDKNRNDITFCTMLFKMPNSENLNKIKNMNRGFERFYLPSLKKLITTFERVALWCDSETALFLRTQGLDKKIQIRIMKFSELSTYDERKETLNILRDMKRKYRGYFLHKKIPENWLDYLPMMMSKPSVIKWAKDNNKFKSDYFMWIDGGCFNKKYEDLWDDWTGKIEAKPNRCRFAIAPTMVKMRPKFVPNIIFKIWKKFIRKKPATKQTLEKQNLINIAMTNADYDVPGGSFVIPKKYVDDFYDDFESARKVLKENNLVAVDQGVFQTMMRNDRRNMYELVYIKDYDRLYTAVSQKAADVLL